MLGACRGLDAGIFYPDDEQDAEVAKQVCEGCSVRHACLEFALARRTACQSNGCSVKCSVRDGQTHTKAAHTNTLRARTSNVIASEI